MADQAGKACHAHAHPNGKCVERACVGVVAFARLFGRLVQVDYDGDACHEKQEEYNPKLFNAALAFVGLP